MSKNTRQQWQDRNKTPDQSVGGPIASSPAGDPDPVETIEPLARDGAIAANPCALGTSKPDANGITRGQVYENVEVPDRPINKLGLRPGARLNPLEIETPYGDGRWMACFVGERATKIEADAQMLKTGKLRA